jgi:hypothetical protein
MEYFIWNIVQLTLPGSVYVADKTYGLLKGTSTESPSMRPDTSKKDILSTSTMMVRDLDGTVRYWSEGTKKLYGWEPHGDLFLVGCRLVFEASRHWAF